MNTTMNNRVEGELHKWLERENSIRALFRPNTTNERYFLKAKMEHFEKLQRKYGNDASQDEKFTLKLLKGETKHLKRMLYPSFVQRAGRDLAKALSTVFRNISGATAHHKAKQLQKEYLAKKPATVVPGSSNDKVKSVQQTKKGLQGKRVHKPVEDIDLLPKLRTHNGKGIKVK